MPESALTSEAVLSDHPINLKDPALLVDRDLLPNIRLIHHRQDILKLTL